MGETSRIEAYLWSSGVTGKQDATQEITITEPGPTAETYTLAEGGRVFADMLTEFQALIAAGGLAGTYSLTWDATAAAVTISATGVASFAVAFAGNMGAVMGFSADVSGSASHTGDEQALGRFDAVRSSCEIPKDGSIVSSETYRFGRHRSVAWGNHDVWSAKFVFASSIAASFLASYCAAGRVRVYQDDGTTTAYSATNTLGYVDGYVAEVSEPRANSRGENWITQTVALAVGR